MADQEAASYERRDVNPKWLAVTAVIIIIGIASCLWLAHSVLDFGKPTLVTEYPGPIPDTVPAPQLRSDPTQDLAEYQRSKRQRLESAGMVDDKAGIAHIPIQQAMDHLAEHG